jgi:HPt (histidine-containing phosphotransfer) domain-containing protein
MLINLKSFVSVADSTGPNLEEKYLPDFETQLSRDFELLRAHLHANNMKTSETLAHKCVGLCDVMGAEALAKELRLIEAGCRTQNALTLHAIADNLDFILQDTCRQMRITLHQMPTELPDTNSANE